MKAIYTIVTPKKYVAKTGKEETKWLPVGTMRETEDGKRFIEWNHTPDITYMVVEQKAKPTNGEQGQE